MKRAISWIGLASVCAIGVCTSSWAQQPQNTIIVDKVQFVGCDSNDGPCTVNTNDWDSMCKHGCEAEKTKTAVESVCNGQKSCSFDVTNEWFAAHAAGYQDPAVGTRKMVFYAWTCNGVSSSGTRTANEGNSGISLNC